MIGIKMCSICICIANKRAGHLQNFSTSETRDVGAGALVVRFRRRRFVGGIDGRIEAGAVWYQPRRMSSGWLVGRVWREGHPCSRCSLASIMEPPSFLGSLSPNKSPRFGLCLRIEQKIGHYLASFSTGAPRWIRVTRRPIRFESPAAIRFS